MSVRHIHANPGEYIAVHRNGGYRPTYHRVVTGGGGSRNAGEALGCLITLGIFLCIIYGYNFFAFIFYVGIIVLIGWFIYTFKTQIGKVLCFLCVCLWKALRWLAPRAWKMLTCAYGTIKSWLAPRARKMLTRACGAIKSRWLKRAESASSATSESSTHRPKDYGKIIQKF